MPIFIAIIVIIFVIILIFQKKKNNRNTVVINDSSDSLSIDERFHFFEDKINSLPYHKKYLLTKNEWNFYKSIKPTCDKYNFHIISKVRLADLVEVDKGLDYSERQTYFNKIQNKHIDFVLCNPENFSVIALLELDDSSHDNPKSIENDKFKDDLCSKVGYKLVRVYSTDDFENVLIRNKIIESNTESEIS